MSTTTAGAPPAVLRAGPVRPSPAALRVSGVLALLAASAAALGLLWSGGEAPAAVTSVRDEQVALLGEGLYRFDSLFRGAGNRGTDLVTLVVVVPLLLAARRAYRSASAAGALALLGLLTWLLYLSASLALGTAYNELFVVYVAMVSLSLSALVLVVRTVDLTGLPPAVLDRLPRRGLAVLLLAGAALTTLVWLEPLVTAALTGSAPPMLLHSTTLVTEVLDLAVVAPAAVLAGLLLLRGRTEGLLLGVPLLVLLWVLAPVIITQTVFQLAAGWSFTPPQVLGPIAGFGVLGTAATCLLVPTLRRLHLSGDARGG